MQTQDRKPDSKFSSVFETGESERKQGMKAFSAVSIMLGIFLECFNKNRENFNQIC